MTFIFVSFYHIENTYTVADQEERSRSVEAFRAGRKDVLVATDVASKGLDFADVKHVINYDMPDDVENYGNVSRYEKLFYQENLRCYNVPVLMQFTG